MSWFLECGFCLLIFVPLFLFWFRITKEKMGEGEKFQLGTVGALSLSVVSSVSIVICNKALMSSLHFIFGKFIERGLGLLAVCKLIWLTTYLYLFFFFFLFLFVGDYYCCVPCIYVLLCVTCSIIQLGLEGGGG